MIQIVPSLLSVNFAEVKKDIEKVELSGVEMLHLDVMDGHFVPNITFGPDFVKSIRKVTDSLLDVHLMIERPDLFIESFYKAGADLISFHYESKADIKSTILKIKDFGLQAGLAINPNTPAEKTLPFIDSLDFILIMSVYPGFSGQSFIADVLEKVTILQEALNERNNQVIKLQIDGGINKNNIAQAANAGIDYIVAGSSVFNGDNIPQNIKELRNIANHALA